MAALQHLSGMSAAAVRVGRVRRPAGRHSAVARAACVLTAAALALGACGGDTGDGGEGADGPGSPAATSSPNATGSPNAPQATGATGNPSPAQSPVTPTATAGFPADAVGGQLRWMVGQMNSDTVQSDLTDRFSTTFLTEVPPAQWLVMLGQLRAQGPWVVEEVSTQDRTGAATLVSQGRRYRLTMTLDDAGRIDGALLNEAARGQAATDWAGVVTRAELAAPQVSILAADVAADGSLKVAHRSGDQGLRPIASMAKLYVLAAVTEAVRDGDLTWDTPLTLTAADKTLPSGTLQDRADGSTVSVREAADLMIRISDNTAADLLIRTVGEPQVRAAANRAGHRHPAGITPFLTPRQMFWLGYGDSEQAKAARSGWAAADEATRRRLLAAVPMDGPGPQNIDPNSAHWRSGIGWFATPAEVVAAQLYLDRLAGTPAGQPLRQILTTNGGIAVEGWSGQAFKGGSDSGVIALSFLAPATGSGNRQALVMIGTGDKAVDEETFVAAAGDAARLLAAAR